MTCTFFGHRDTPEHIKPILEETIIALIINHNVNTFYVGTHGKFDTMVKRALEKIKKFYPSITCIQVLSYLSNQMNLNENTCFEYVFPDILEKTLPKFAIIKRNEWMIDHSDYVITYIEHNFGGAAKFANRAHQRNKNVINLYKL